MMKRLLLTVALCAPLISSAASVDGKTAALADEKAICTNLSMNDKNVEMVTQYNFLSGLFAMGARGKLQDDQQAWLKIRRQCASSVGCLKRTNNRRLAQLDKSYDGINKPLS